MEVDVLIVSDFRFPGGTSTSIASEVTALSRAGYRVGLLAIAARLLSPWRTMHPEITSLIAAGHATFVQPGEPVRAGLCCLHHPSVFEQYPAQAPQVRAKHSVIIAHHPPLDTDGTAQYDIAAISRVCRELFGKPVWAPVGPNVRNAFARLKNPPPLTTHDWVNMIEPDDFRALRHGLIGAIPVIGRHSRPDPIKWPENRETFLKAYPDNPGVKVRLMGFDERLEAVVAPRPVNWQVLDFNAMPVREFLAGIDYFSYFHSPVWIEAFGRAVLEAMAAGKVCLLPPSFEPVFKEGAVYCTPAQVLGLVKRFQRTPDLYAKQSAKAVAVVTSLYGPAQAVGRVNALIGPPRERASTSPPEMPDTRPRVMYLTSNGVGMGHLTRALASARRLDKSCVPIIATMSKAFGVVRDQGIMAEYVPYFRATGMADAPWQENLEKEISELLRYYNPSVFVFDGNVPYGGMLRALSRFPHLWKIWERRGMWRPGSGEKIIKRQSQFDAVIEPGDIAGVVDRGPTVDSGGSKLKVPPIRYLRDTEMLPKLAARSIIGLNPNRPAVLLQLGSGNNFATSDLFKTIHGMLTQHRAAAPPQIVIGEWSISNEALDLPDDVIRMNTYPFARFLNAFDYAVAMAGYNTFHENLMAGLPTLFVSNDNPEQDEQWLRAEYAAMRGLCLSARSHDPYAISRGLIDIAETAEQGRLRRMCRTLPPQNGADQVAQYLAELALTRKTYTVG